MFTDVEGLCEKVIVCKSASFHSTPEKKMKLTFPDSYDIRSDVFLNGE